MTKKADAKVVIDCSTEKTRPARRLSIEERTLPKRLRSSEPDVTVVVGGVEFFHYKLILCMSCSFFDTAFSSQMKETQNGCCRIEFPDKNPDEWPQVHRFLDPFESVGVEDLLEVVPTEGNGTGLEIIQLLQWFDYLGLVALVKKADQVAAKKLKYHYENENCGPSHSLWNRIKYLPCPHTQNELKNLAKHTIGEVISYMQVETDYSLLGEVKKYVLDDECGEEMWGFLTSKVRLPPRMLQELDKKTIVESPTFNYLLALCARISSH
jgi:hypothetical protein